MIRINLLGVPRQKKGKRGSSATAMPEMAGTGPGAVLFLVAGVVLGALVFFYFYHSANAASAQIAKDMETANREGTRLAGVKVKYEQRKKEAEASEKRVKVISQLSTDQSGPVTLLNAIGRTVNNTDAVWLNTMTETGNSVSIDGTALSTQAVANLMSNLKRSGYFRNVEIKEARQDASVKDTQAFVFSLTCEKQPKS